MIPLGVLPILLVHVLVVRSAYTATQSLVGHSHDLVLVAASLVLDGLGIVVCA